MAAQRQLIGVRERDLPGSWEEFGEYLGQMTAERLERTAAVEEVLGVHQLDLVTARLLGAELRARLGVPWSRRKERELQLLARASRAMTPLLPRTLRNVGPAYLRWRNLEAGPQAA